MLTILITLPCTAQELENALHAACDHHAAWDAKIKLGWEKPHPVMVSMPVLRLEETQERKNNENA